MRLSSGALPAAFCVAFLLGCSADEAPDGSASAGLDSGQNGPPDAQAPDGPDTTPDTRPDTTTPTWRSALYPPDWTPAHAPKTKHLHDFSWAGYHNGDVPLPTNPPGKVFDVIADHGADPTGAVDATAAMQSAIDAAAKAGGGIVHIGPGDFRCDGTLSVNASNTVLRGDGPDQSRIRFTRHADMAYKAHITIGVVPGQGSEFPLVVDAPAGVTVLTVADAGDLKPGDDVDVGWFISDAFVAEHGMTGTWKAFNGKWMPFFRRDVLAVDKASSPHRVTVRVPLRYPALLRDKASLRRTSGWLREVGVQGIGLANAVSWTDAWSHDQVQVLELRGVADGWVRDVSSFAAPQIGDGGFMPKAHLQSGGILIRASKRVTVANCHLARAQHRGSGGNGYLFQVRTSSELLTRDCSGRDGRHNFIQNWGFGLTGCVWLRIESSGGKALLSPNYDIGGLGYSEFHHSLATANLVDDSVIDDGWASRNRHDWSTGAGQTATENVLWNIRGSGRLLSYNWGHGYVIGTGPENEVVIDASPADGQGTAPLDHVEGAGLAAHLVPQSLYLDQLARRLGP